MSDLIQLAVVLGLIFAVANRNWLVSFFKQFFSKAKKSVDQVVTVAEQPASGDAAKQAVIELGRNAWDWDLDKLYANAWAIHEPNALAQLAEAYRARDQAKIDELQSRLNKRLFRKEKPDKNGAEGGDQSANAK